MQRCAGALAFVTIWGGYRDGGGDQAIPVAAFFRTPGDFYPLETDALRLCRGRVLDAGAGTGVHSRWLQKRGYTVTAVDAEPEAVAIMRAAGLRDVRCADIMSLSGEVFDTVLVPGRSIGMAGRLAALSALLGRFYALTPVDGQVLLGSLDIERTDDPVLQGCAYSARAAGRYPGETRFVERFRGQRGQLIEWLYVAPDALAVSASESGWEFDVLRLERDGNYLARLLKPSP